MSEELKTLKSIEGKLDQLLKWTRFAGMQQLRTILAQNLTTDTEMLIYELSDGERGTREVAALSGVGSNATVANYWRKWSRLGIVEPSVRRQGRFRRICSLEEVGLTVPPMPQATAETEQPVEASDEQR
jgi:hypothetical protein